MLTVNIPKSVPQMCNIVKAQLSSFSRVELSISHNKHHQNIMSVNNRIIIIILEVLTSLCKKADNSKFATYFSLTGVHTLDWSIDLILLRADS